MESELIGDKSKKTKLALLFLLCGILALGPFQWGNIPMDDITRAVYKIITPITFLIITIVLYRNERFKEYWQIFFAFFVGATAFLIAWLGAQFIIFSNTSIDGFVYNKVRDAILIVSTIIILIKASGSDLGSIFIKRGNIQLGIIIGLATFTIFALFSIPGATLLFNAKNVSLEKVLLWAPWILLFIFASGCLEEFLYRALFLKKYRKFFGFNGTNFLQALIFCTIHISVTYSPMPIIFVIITFFLGLAWSDVMQRTDSVLASVLFHAGSDILVIIGVFSVL